MSASPALRAADRYDLYSAVVADVRADDTVTVALDEALDSGRTAGRAPREYADRVRIERVRHELAAGFAALDDVNDAVAVFGSTRSVPDDSIYALARTVAAKLGQAGYAIMTGGGTGIMEAANLGAHDAGALSIGLPVGVSRALSPNTHVDRLVPLRHLFVRKLLFARHASAFVVFPGDYSTLDQLFEAVSSIQHQQDGQLPVILVGTGFWQGLIDWLEDRLVHGGKLERGDVASLLVTNDADEVVAHVTRTRTRALLPAI